MKRGYMNTRERNYTDKAVWKYDKPYKAMISLMERKGLIRN